MMPAKSSAKTADVESVIAHRCNLRFLQFSFQEVLSLPSPNIFLRRLELTKCVEFLQGCGTQWKQLIFISHRDLMKTGLPLQVRIMRVHIIVHRDSIAAQRFGRTRKMTIKIRFVKQVSY